MVNTKYNTFEYSENWLRSYTRYIAGYGELFDLNVTDEKSFIKALREEYLGLSDNSSAPSSVFTQDIKFNENLTQIIASRFIMQAINLPSSKEEKEALISVRKIAEDQQPYFNVTMYHPWFRFADQYLIIRELTIKLISTAAGIVMLVAIIFIPNLTCSLCVFFTIATIEMGILGFMCLWGISLDIISLLCLIMCIGFSVDFSAHISYAYISAEGSPEERIQHAMHSLGLPILQSGISTIIGILALAFASSYIFQAFFKIVFLVILFATWHGLFVLPVLLLIIRPERFSCSTSLKKKTYHVSNSNKPVKLESLKYIG